MRGRLLPGLILTASAALPAAAQLPPVGGQFQVNTYTPDHQRRPAVALRPSGGGFVVVWQSLGSTDGDSSFYSVHGQRFDADGSAAGAQFQINQYTTNDQRFPDVAMASDGRFLVVWESIGSNGGDTSAGSVQARLYEANGTAPESQFQVNTLTSNTQRVPAVAVGPADDFVVVWHSDVPSGGGDISGYSIQGQRFDAEAQPVGTQFRVNSYTTSSQSYPAIARAGDGGFVVVWQSFGSDGGDSSFHSIQGQRFAANGTPLGGQFQVNVHTTGEQLDPAVAQFDDGRFVVVWESVGAPAGDPSGFSVRGRRYAADGTPAGTEFQVNSYVPEDQRHPSVATSRSGGFVVAWESEGSYGADDSGWSVVGQRYSSSGVPLGSEFEINSFIDNNQERPHVAATKDGDSVVVWSSFSFGGDDDSNTSIQGQIYRLILFADGFESGSAGAWSDTAP